MKGVKNMTDREHYLLKRRKLKIRMNELAAYVGCSQSLISKFETGKCEMSDDKIRRYRDYIDCYK
ncbi:helix-turn-helix domain-containing protein [Priestia koreensis]|uniref:helix-turn-helix domain-containing protein n=1 Tax=Priestia koreensis TaxID=284581 RepID=UPI003CFC245D